MKYILCAILFITFGLSPQVRADDIKIIRSEPVDGIILELRLLTPDGIANIGNRITYDFVALSNGFDKLYIPKDKFFCTVKLFDPTGNSVPFKAGSPTFGGRFAALSTFASNQSWSVIQPYIKIMPPRPRHEAIADMVTPEPDGGYSTEFPMLSDLFATTHAGTYKVIMQFQVYGRKVDAKLNQTFTLVRFNPLQFTVTK